MVTLVHECVDPKCLEQPLVPSRWSVTAWGMNEAISAGHSLWQVLWIISFKPRNICFTNSNGGTERRGQAICLRSHSAAISGRDLDAAHPAHQKYSTDPAAFLHLLTLHEQKLLGPDTCPLVTSRQLLNCQASGSRLYHHHSINVPFRASVDTPSPRL